MVQVARRFEIAGRAATANRFELAEFEVGELEELFEDDVPNSELPKEGPTAHIPAVAQGFLKANLPEMKKAAATKDPVAFQDAFQRAASICNACHQASAKGFIQIPAVPGKPVPDLDPIASPGKAP
jgi:mono/diheme cytochrome c family protein